MKYIYVLCERVGEFQGTGRRIKRKVLVEEDKGEGAGKGEKKSKGKKEETKEGIESHAHNLLITTCEIRCVTASANDTGANTTSTYHGNVAPDQETLKHQSKC